MQAPTPHILLLCDDVGEARRIRGMLEEEPSERPRLTHAKTLPVAAMFILIGAVPYSELVAGVVERNSAGFILTGQDLTLTRDGHLPRSWMLNRDPFLLETSVPGIFAAGDVRQGAINRVAAAVGQGGMVVSFVHQYLKTV